MKTIIFYEKRVHNGIIYRFYFRQPGVDACDIEYAHRFEDELNAKMYAKNELPLPFNNYHYQQVPDTLVKK
jgi:hypothetical protein